MVSTALVVFLVIGSQKYSNSEIAARFSFLFVVTDSQVEHSNLVGVSSLKTSEVALRN